MKKFVTIFPYTENVHLLKDVGAIPYSFHKYLGYESVLVTIENGEYPYNEQYAKGLQLEFMKGDVQKCRKNAWYEFRLIKRYITRHAREIDVLNLYHMSLQHLLLLAYYKTLNRNGIAFLKMDADLGGFSRPTSEHTEVKRNPMKKIIRRWLFDRVDIISAESNVVCERASYIYGREITYVPNGFFDFDGDKADLGQKENIFLTVGRLGNYQKNTESILRAFAQIYQRCDWNLVLVGPVEGNFISDMNELFNMHEGLSKRVIYKGSISDKTELSRVYESSKVFLLPSRYESFGLVVVEAQSAGCYLVLSDQVAPCADFTDNGRLGDIIPAEDDDALAEAMLRAAEEGHDYEAARQHAYSHFTWERICENLNSVFLQRRKEPSDSE